MKNTHHMKPHHKAQFELCKNCNHVRYYHFYNDTLCAYLKCDCKKFVESGRYGTLDNKIATKGSFMDTLGQVRKTERGFEVLEFVDRCEVKCSLQQSSLATERAIWLGCDDADPQVLVPGQGWTSLESIMPKGYIANTRMQLTEDQVQKLIVHLQDWLETDSFVPRKEQK
jgi:hypothetical protein